MPRSQGNLALVADFDDSADLAEIELLAEGMPDAFVRCRSLGHNLVPHTATRYRNAFDVVLRCTRCKTRKHQTVSSRGLLIGHSHYEYPDGYLIKGHGQHTADKRGVFRLNAILRGNVTERLDEEI